MGTMNFAARVYVEEMEHVRISANDLEKIALEYMNFVARDFAVKMERA